MAFVGPRLQTDGTYRFTLVRPSFRPSVTDYLGNRLMKFSEIWYIHASQQNKMLQIIFFGFRPFFGRFLTKKQPKLTKNEENWQNPNRLMKFSEIWYVDASQQKKCYKKTFFGFRPFLAVF